MVASDHDDHFSRFLDVIKRSDRKVESMGKVGAVSEAGHVPRVSEVPLSVSS